jgi:hypothetical protein
MKLVVRVGSTYNLMTRKHYWNKQKEDPAAGCAITTLRGHSRPFLMASSSTDDNRGCGGGTEIQRWSLA